MPGSSSSRPQQGGGGAPPPPPPQHVPAGFDPSTGTYTQPVVYQQQPQGFYPFQHHPQQYGGWHPHHQQQQQQHPQQQFYPPHQQQWGHQPPPPHHAGPPPPPVPQPPPPPPPPPAEIAQTATIRNAVNLKKGSLRLVPSDPQGKRYHLRFEFDASAPAAATVFFGAAEDPRRRCALRAATVGIEASGSEDDGDANGGNGGKAFRLLASKVAAVYPQGGMGLCFPPPAPSSSDDEEQKRHRLVVEGCSIAAETAAALAADSERAMSHQASSSFSSSSSSAAPAALPPFAVAVRLEALTTPEGAEKDAELLRSLVPGAPHSAGTQSQTTFARILPVRKKPPPAAAAQQQGGGGGGEGGGGGDGGGEAPGDSSQPPPQQYEIRVVKQKIWVAGVSYELQEIYGMDAAASSAAAAAGRAAANAAPSSTPSDQAAAAAAATTAAANTEAATAAATTAMLPPSTTPTATDEERLCVVCLCEPRDTTVLPCRHMCMCGPCAAELRRAGGAKCPICRVRVEALLHIRLQGAAAAAGPPPAPVPPPTAAAAANGEGS